MEEGERIRSRLRRSLIGNLRRRVDGPRRVRFSSTFPSQPPGTPPKRHSYPIVTIEEATSGGLGGPDGDEVFQEEP